MQPLIDVLPAVALTVGILWPSLRRYGVLTEARRTLRDSRSRVLPL